MTFIEFKKSLKEKVDAQLAKIPRDKIGLAFGAEHRAHYASLLMFRNAIDHHHTMKSLLIEFDSALPSPFKDVVCQFIMHSLVAEFDKGIAPEAARDLTQGV